MSSARKRIAWPDWVKGIGILSIVMAHVTQYFPGSALCQHLNKVLCSYHVPIFFIWGGISAAIWPDKYEVSRRLFYLKRVKRYLIPYFFFSLFNSALKLSVLLITHKLTESVLKEELTALLITGNGTVWFLVTIFFIEILFYESKSSPFLRSIILSVGLIFPFLLSPFTANAALLLLTRTVIAFSYFMLGYLLWGWNLPFLEGISPEKLSFIGLFMIILGIIMSQAFAYQIEFFTGVFVNGAAAIPVSLTISVGIILCCFSIRNKTNPPLSTIQYFGRESMLVMLIHPTILLFFTYPFGNWFGSLRGVMAFVLSMLMFILVSALNVPFTHIIDRWFPILKGETPRID